MYYVIIGIECTQGYFRVFMFSSMICIVFFKVVRASKEIDYYHYLQNPVM